MDDDILHSFYIFFQGTLLLDHHNKRLEAILFFLRNSVQHTLQSSSVTFWNIYIREGSRKETVSNALCDDTRTLVSCKNGLAR